jgi:multidrug resistance protein
LLALLSAITALAFCGLHMVVPALPRLVAAFDDSPAHVQLVVSLYLAGIAAGQLVYGPVSDRFGRRPVLLAGLAAFLVGTALFGAAWSLSALIAGRVLQALGACAGIVLSRAMIRDVYEREAAARGLALVMMAMTLAPAISPALGAYLAEWLGWRASSRCLAGWAALFLRRCTSSRSLATSIPTKCSMSRPCACGLAWRPRRLFGLEEAADAAPGSGAGSGTRGSEGLPSATAAPTLLRRRDEREIQGRSRGADRCRPTSPAAMPPAPGCARATNMSSPPQKCRLGFVVRTGMARARVKIGLANLAYNFTRLAWLNGQAAPA